VGWRAPSSRPAKRDRSQRREPRHSEAVHTIERAMTGFERAKIYSRRELSLEELRRSQNECDRQALVRPINWQSVAASDALGERSGPSRDETIAKRGGE